MIVSSKKYALILYELVRGKSQAEIKSIVGKFLQFLIENNDIFKIDDILKHFIKTWNKQEGIVEADVISAWKADKEIIELLNNYIAKLTDAKKIIINEKVDKNILGGVIIKYKDKILDGSLRTRLESFRKQIAK